MARDADKISKEEHELNYLLKKWKKKQSISNRKTLAGKIDKFNANKAYRTHNREDFYKTVDFLHELE